MPIPLLSRLSSRGTSVVPSPISTSPTNDPSRPASSSGRRMSKDTTSEIGYPSWLPKRPPPPAPRSTFHSDAPLEITETPRPPSAGPSVAFGGRKPTPRSVRILSLRDNPYGTERDREPTDQTRVASDTTRDNPRAWSRATAPPHARLSTSETTYVQDRIPEPRFRAKALRPEHLETPSIIYRLWFYLMRIIVFANIPLQSFLDLNAVFMLIQVARFPNPEAPGIPGSGKNWALAAAGYVACWVLWIFIVFLVYEIVYSFVRRWRVKRPLMYPIYLSSPAFNLVAISSYTNFCFLQYIRQSAFVGELGSLRDGLAETFWFYSQNTPTVALLLPRAGISLALILAFTTPDVTFLQLSNSGIVNQRDPTFFRPIDGTLTNYAIGVLWTNISWTAWRLLIVIISWIGLWFVSGTGFAGLCGPRYRWEEEDNEKTLSIYSDNTSDLDALGWDWKERTKLRILDAYDFCLTIKPHYSASWMKRRRRHSHHTKDFSRDEEEKDMKELLGSASGHSGLDPEGVQRVLAAIGLPSGPQAARRPILTDDFFQGPGGELLVPRTETPPELSAGDKRKGKRSSKSSGEQKRGSSPYPFTAEGAALSSDDKVPFPPSPLPSDHPSSGDDAEAEVEEDEEEEDDVAEEDMEGDDEGAGFGESGEDPSSGRASGSMSSLGQPIGSRYPFQFRHPTRRSTSTQSNSQSNSNSRSMRSRVSAATQSTGNRETTSDSMSQRSPISYHSRSSDPVPPIPMPPRHPRARSGTVPSPSGIAFPPADRVRTGSAGTQAFGIHSPVFRAHRNRSGSDVNPDTSIGIEEHELSPLEVDQPDAEGSQEAAEGEDVVGLLSDSRGPSPRSSQAHIRQIGSNLSLTAHRRGGPPRSGSASHSGSRTTSQSASSSRSRAGSISISVAVRSRAQSLLQSVESASRSSVELVQTAIRSRANSSMARLEDDIPHLSSQDGRTHSRSGSGSVSRSDPTSAENYTFGQPLRQPEQIVEEQSILESEPSIRNDSPAPAAPPPDSST